MNREQTKEVFKIIKSVYPTFEVSSEKLDVWSKLLREQDYEAVINNTEGYVLNNKFPPTITDIREKKVESRNRSFIDKVKQWEADAVGFKPRS